MNNIINYIKQSEGLGAKYLLIFSCIAALVLTIAFRSSQNSLPERLQKTADQLLPIKIENGNIVEPDNIIKTITFDLFDNAQANERIYISLNTTVDSLNPQKLKQGIYITRKAIYTVSRQQIRTTYLESSFDVPAADYRPFFKKVVNYATLIVFIITAPVLFIAYFAFCLFYSWCMGVIAKFLKRKTDFDMRMRSSIVTLIPLKTLSYLLSAIGISFSGFTMFIATLFCLSLILMRLPIETAAEKEN